MHPSEFLQVADDLWKKGTLEGAFRSSISRSYYAAYWLVGKPILEGLKLELLAAASLSRKNEHLGHERLIQVLKASSNRDIVALGEKLEELRVARVKADYKLEMKIQKHKAEEEYRNAMDIHALLNAIGTKIFLETLSRDLAHYLPPTK